MSKVLSFLANTIADPDMPLNSLELTSVNALLAYAAHEHRINEEALRDRLTRQFGVAAVDGLHGRDYEQVIRYLVDLQADIILN